MKDTIVITSIYHEFKGTKKFEESCKRVGLPYYNAWPGGQFTGNHVVLNAVYKAMLKFRDEYKYMIYSDGADTYFLKSFTPPNEKIIYSAEKACYPIVALATEYPETPTPWKYLNSGNYCGEIPLVVEFFEKYGLKSYNPSLNAQYVTAVAYLKAKKDGFPIELDLKGDYFQTIAFTDPGDFTIGGGEVVNNITGSRPCIIHGNGVTDMSEIYKLHN